MEATDSHEVLRGPLVEVVPALLTSHELLHGSRYTAIITASSLAGVRTDSRRPAFAIAGTKRYERVSVLVVCIHVHSITAEPCFALRVLSTRNNTRAKRVVTKLLINMLPHLTMTFISKTKRLRTHMFYDIFDLLFKKKTHYGDLGANFVSFDTIGYIQSNI
jgi:hypothetical protein